MRNKIVRAVKGVSAVGMRFERILPLPQEVKEKYPISKRAAAAKERVDAEIKNILCGNDKRLLLIIGPCSADNEEAVLEYVHRLKEIQEQVREKLLLVPRVYTNKPRTNGDGYKGMLHQPDPNAQPDLLKGLLAIREMQSRVLEETDLPIADEMLYPAKYEYFSDILSYVAVGARSVENQEHRLVSSGVSAPVGMKNPTGGDLSVMLNAVHAAQSRHSFAYRGWEVETTGNPLAHAILRGSISKHGENVPNYHYEDLEFLYQMYAKSNLANMAVIVDCNHSNSGKNYLEQRRICKEVLHSCRHNADIGKMVKGFMLESYLEDGSQKVGEGVYGKSITDPCLGWEKSRDLIWEIADLV